MELLATDTHFYLRRDQHVIAFSKEDSTLAFKSFSLDLLKTASSIDSYVYFIGVIKIFGYNFLLVCKPAVPAINFIDVAPLGSGFAPSHALLDDEMFCHPLRLENVILLHADTVDRYVHFILRNAIADMCQHCYIDTSRRFAPNDIYCWNRHLYPVDITGDEQISKFRLESMVRECIAYVFSGFYEHWRLSSSSYLTLWMDRCIDNSGHRYFSRGINRAGFTANTARVRLYYNNTLVYTLFRGSLPIVFSQPPSPIFTPPIFIPDNPKEEASLIRFNDLFCRHIELLFSNTDSAPVHLFIINLLKNRGDVLYDQPLPSYDAQDMKTADEYALTATFTEILRNSALIRKKSCPSLDIQLINYHMHKHTNTETNSLAEKIISVTTTSKESKVTAKEFVQTGYPRINCLDCVDRTTLFQMLILINAFNHYAKVMNVDLPDSFKLAIRSMSFACGDVCSSSYVGAPPQKRLVNLHAGTPGAKYIDGIYDLCNSLFRYITNRYTQQINVYNNSVFRNQNTAYHVDILACLNLPMVLVFMTWIVITLDVLTGYYNQLILRLCRCFFGGILLVSVVIIVCCARSSKWCSTPQKS